MSQHKLALLVLSFFIGGRASALDAFECVRDLIPITGPASFQIKRSGFEKPFMPASKFMAFPEIKSGRVSGFYLYTVGQAWYYDTLSPTEMGARPLRISELDPKALPVMYELVVQPLGLETVTMYYMPGFGIKETTTDAPTALGSTLLPVIGGLMSRTGEPLHTVYRNPRDSDEVELKKWAEARSSRSPASAGSVPYTRRMAKLSTQQTKSKDELWEPLQSELIARKKWLQNHNLDEENFKHLSRLMQGTCRE